MNSCQSHTFYLHQRIAIKSMFYSQHDCAISAQLIKKRAQHQRVPKPETLFRHKALIASLRCPIRSPRNDFMIVDNKSGFYDQARSHEYSSFLIYLFIFIASYCGLRYLLARELIRISCKLFTRKGKGCDVFAPRILGFFVDHPRKELTSSRSYPGSVVKTHKPG